MKRESIGELEEMVLLIVGVLYEEAYGVSVLNEMMVQAGREVNISAIHSVLNRLEEKGLLTSRMGGASQVRGGRRKRFYTITNEGRSVLDEVKFMRDKLYNQLPLHNSLS
jgi:DNA-binding PadR family transcriptional regulator